jgi:hypothetical protein
VVPALARGEQQREVETAEHEGHDRAGPG